MLIFTSIFGNVNFFSYLCKWKRCIIILFSFFILYDISANKSTTFFSYYQIFFILFLSIYDKVEISLLFGF